MYKTLQIALREFASTVLTKGFILGVLMTPLMVLLVVGGIILAKTLKGPTLQGVVAVVDRSGAVAPEVQRRFDPATLKKERDDALARAQRLAAEKARDLGMDQGKVDQAGTIAGMAIENAMDAMASMTVDVLPSDADVEKEKATLADVDLAKAKERGERPRIMVAVIPEGAVRPDAEGRFGRYEVFTANRLDPEIQERIEGKINGAIIDARVARDPRAAAGNLTARDLRALLEEPESKSAAITREGEKKSGGGLQMMLPAAFMLLLLMSVMTGGQYLLTTTIEEKSSRVMEVLLSAVSPMQLMVGKIVGQMCVGLLILVLYSGIGVASLIAFSLQHLVSPMLLVYMLVFFFIAFFVIASLMAAVGSAVSELREAQTLMTPVMVLMMLPWLLWLPISRAPNSGFATAMSFVPGVNPFVMMIRLAGAEPPPAWQVPVAIAVGLATVVLCAWGAAKIFRVGVLMYGKAPDWKTLIRWIRMA